jgi:hypothetical protein
MAAETVADIEADIAALRAARSKLARGEMITEVWRDGRRLTYAKPSIESLSDLIEDRLRDLASAEAAAAGSGRRGAIPLGWRN